MNNYMQSSFELARILPFGLSRILPQLFIFARHIKYWMYALLDYLSNIIPYMVIEISHTIARTWSNLIFDFIEYCPDAEHMIRVLLIIFTIYSLCKLIGDYLNYVKYTRALNSESDLEAGIHISDTPISDTPISDTYIRKTDRPNRLCEKHMARYVKLKID